MKLDREKFLAAALVMGAALTTTACGKKEETPAADPNANQANSVNVKPKGAPNAEGVGVRVVPTTEGGPRIAVPTAPNTEGVSAPPKVRVAPSHPLSRSRTRKSLTAFARGSPRSPRTS